MRPTNDSWRVDETYIEVKGKQKYLDRAIDSTAQTWDFILTAKRFLCKALRAVHNQEPRVINVAKNAACPKAVDELRQELRS